MISKVKFGGAGAYVHSQMSHPSKFLIIDFAINVVYNVQHDTAGGLICLVSKRNIPMSPNGIFFQAVFNLIVIVNMLNFWKKRY